jgi:hypothetical protein
VHPPARFPLRWTIAAVAIGAAGALLFMRGLPWGATEEQVRLLDPAQVVVLRTPGGFLEVATLVKTEEFRWRSSYTCLGQDCGALFGALVGERIGQIRVPVHYTYRIPLADTWTLKLDGEAYVLDVPAPKPALPPGIDTQKAEITSERGGLVAPPAAANQANLLKNLGPELAQRAQRIEYLNQQMPAAEKTVQEFAEKWMKAQSPGPARPVRVRFRMGDNG